MGATPMLRPVLSLLTLCVGARLVASAEEDTAEHYPMDGEIQLRRMKPRKLATDDGYLYVAAENGGLLVYDAAGVENGTEPEHVKTVRTESRIPSMMYDVQVVGDVLYTLESEPGLFLSHTTGKPVPLTKFHYSTYNVSAGWEPLGRISSEFSDSQPWAALVVGDYAYVLFDGVYTVDVSDPTNLTLTHRIYPSEQLPVWASCITWHPDIPGFLFLTYYYNDLDTAPSVRGDDSEVTGYNGFMILNIDPAPERPRVRRVLGARGHYTDLAVVRDRIRDRSYVYITSDWAGLVIYDVTYVDAPVMMGTLTPDSPDITLNRTFAITARGGKAYVSDLKYGIVVFDTTKPPKPVQVAAMPAPYVRPVLLFTEETFFAGDLFNPPRVWWGSLPHGGFTQAPPPPPPTPVPLTAVPSTPVPATTTDVPLPTSTTTDVPLPTHPRQSRMSAAVHTETRATPAWTHAVLSSAASLLLGGAVFLLYRTHRRRAARKDLVDMRSAAMTESSRAPFLSATTASTAHSSCQTAQSVSKKPSSAAASQNMHTARSDATKGAKPACGLDNSADPVAPATTSSLLLHGANRSTPSDQPSPCGSSLDNDDIPL